MHRATFVTALTLGLLAAAPAHAASIALILPPSAVQGDPVLVVGGAFGPHGPTITVCGVSARVVFGSETVAIFTVPNTVPPGPCRLVVTGANGRAAAAAFTVRNRTPSANAGPSQTVSGRTARLDGTRSFDPDGQALRFAWSIVSAPVGGTAKLNDATSSTPSVIVDTPGTYTFRLVVTDPSAAVAAAATQVTFVYADTTPPVVHINGVTDGQVTNAASITPVFTATDDNLAGVSAVLDGASFASGTPVAGEGPHTLVVTATDAANNRTTVTVHFTLDRTPPAIVVSGVRDGEVRSGPATIEFSASDANPGPLSAMLDGSLFVSGVTVAAEGGHVLVVIATDAAGNTAARSVRFTIDQTPPLVLVRSPTDGSVGSAPLATVLAEVTDAGGLTSVNANGLPLTLGVDGAYHGDVPLAEGANIVAVVATDLAGNVATQVVHVVRDTTTPTLGVLTPADGARIASLTTTVAGIVSDATPVVVQVDGVPTPIAADGSFAASVALVPGGNTIVVDAIDAAGNESHILRQVRANTTPPSLALAAPSDGSATAANLVIVSGTASAADLTDAVLVTVNGAPAAVGSDGSFSTTVSLAAGSNLIHIVATDGYGLESTANVTVVQDAVPPELSLSSPADGALIGASAVRVAGSVADASAVTVSVDGSTIPVAGGEFDVAVSLSPGANTIVVTASDAAGNESRVVRHVRSNTTPPSLALTAPSDGLVTTDSFIVVSGTAFAADPADRASVTVSGVPVSVAADGSFSKTVPLAPGANLLHVVAADGYGLASTVNVTVSRALLGNPPP